MLHHNLFDSLNRMIDGHRQSQYIFSLIMFNENMTYIFKQVPFSRVKNIEEKEFEFSGMTALYDVVGNLFNELYYTLDHPTTLFIITDGDDNNSKNYTKQNVNDMIKIGEQHAWTFIHCDTKWSTLQTTYKMNFNNDNLETLFDSLTI